MKDTNKTKQRNAKDGLTPWSFTERARKRSKPGEAEWFNIRREAQPEPKVYKPGPGIVVPKRLLRDANKLIHASFVPPEAEVSMLPRAIGRETPRLLRRFSGKSVIPMNSTFLEGNDDRQIYYDSMNYPYCCVGLVNVPGGWGTGTIVGKNFILTAAHVLGGLWSPGQPLTQTITFTPAMFGGTSSLGPTWKANVTQIAAWDGSASVVGYDMALCRLDKPMGSWLGYFGSRGYDEGWEGHAYWEHNGYPYDLSPGGNKPCYQFSVTIDDDDNDDFDTVELETDADIARTSSVAEAGRGCPVCNTQTPCSFVSGADPRSGRSMIRAPLLSISRGRRAQNAAFPEAVQESRCGRLHRE